MVHLAMLPRMFSKSVRVTGTGGSCRSAGSGPADKPTFKRRCWHASSPGDNGCSQSDTAAVKLRQQSSGAFEFRMRNRM